MMYVGTESAKILTFNLSDLYEEPVNKSTIFKKKEIDESSLSKEYLESMMKNQAE